MRFSKTQIFWILLFSICLIFSAACKKKSVPVEPPPTIEAPVEPSPPITPEPTPPPQPPPAPRVPKKNLEAPPITKRAPSPGDPASLKLVNSGTKQMNAGNLDEAEQLFEQALRVSPTNGRPYYYLGVIASKQKNYDRAMGFLTQAEIHLHGDAFWMSQVYLQEGLVLKAQNRKAEAKEKFEQAVRSDPTNKWAQSELKK
jgi:TolA-binding protein